MRWWHTHAIETAKQTGQPSPYIGLSAAHVTGTWGGDFASEVYAQPTPSVYVNSYLFDAQESIYRVRSEVTMTSPAIKVPNTDAWAFNVAMGGSESTMGVGDFTYTLCRGTGISGANQIENCVPMAQPFTASAPVSFRNPFASGTELAVSGSLALQLYTGAWNGRGGAWGW